MANGSKTKQTGKGIIKYPLQANILNYNYNVGITGFQYIRTLFGEE